MGAGQRDGEKSLELGREWRKETPGEKQAQDREWGSQGRGRGWLGTLW